MSQFFTDNTLICNPKGMAPSFISIEGSNTTVPITPDITQLLNGLPCTSDGSTLVLTGSPCGLGDISGCKPLNAEGMQEKASDYVLNDFLKGYQTTCEFYIWDAVLLLCWIIGLRIATILVTAFVNHNKR